MFSEILISQCSSKAVFPKVCSEDTKASTSNTQGIRGYISVMATLKFAYILYLKKYGFIENNRQTSVIVDMSITYDRISN